MARLAVLGMGLGGLALSGCRREVEVGILSKVLYAMAFLNLYGVL